MKTPLLVVSLLLSTLPNLVSAQKILKKRCKTVKYEQYLRANEPSRESIGEFENWLAPKLNEIRSSTSKTSNTTAIITIPVVVHVIHNGDAIGVKENISDAQVLSQITVLNQDFRRLTGTRGYNSNPVGADVQIEFCMAQRKPDGTATNGIDRVKKTTAQYQLMSATESMKKTTQWDPTQYFNIWTVYFSDTPGVNVPVYDDDMYGTLGYAQFPSATTISNMYPGGAANTDGLVIDFRAFGSSDIVSGTPLEAPYDKGRTTTHEIGHCLGLHHIWGDGNGDEDAKIPDCSASDYCADTPQAGYEHSTCGTYDTCPSSPGKDMPENYMDYTTDACMNIFTINQRDRINIVMNNSPRRVSLKTSLACSAPLANNEYEYFKAIKIAPNPVRDVLNISIGQLELPDNITIYNELGQEIHSKNITSASDLTVTTDAYNSGNYIVKLTKNNASMAYHFIKE